MHNESCEHSESWPRLSRNAGSSPPRTVDETSTSSWYLESSNPSDDPETIVRIDSPNEEHFLLGSAAPLPRNVINLFIERNKSEEAIVGVGSNGSQPRDRTGARGVYVCRVVTFREHWRTGRCENALKIWLITNWGMHAG